MVDRCLIPGRHRRATLLELPPEAAQPSHQLLCCSALGALQDYDSVVDPFPGLHQIPIWTSTARARQVRPRFEPTEVMEERRTHFQEGSPDNLPLTGTDSPIVSGGNVIQQDSDRQREDHTAKDQFMGDLYVGQPPVNSLHLSSS